MPLLSVFMITYNHEKFIEKAIDSLIIQQTQFPIKVIISDDCSTDRTKEILKLYKKNYPDIIEVFFNPQNIGASKNAARTFGKCFNSGAKYIAMLEGDDYWTDPLKLQKQVDFLEQNRDYSLCITNYNIIDENDNIKNENAFVINKDTLTDADVIRTWAPTLTMVYRTADFEEKWLGYFQQVYNVDVCLAALLCQKGKAKFLNFSSANYRKHSGGIFSKKSKIFKYENRLNTYYALLNILKLNNKVKRELVSAIRNHYINLYGLYSADKQKRNSLLIKSLLFDLKYFSTASLRIIALSFFNLFKKGHYYNVAVKEGFLK